MSVVAAGVHDALRLAAEGEVVRLLDGQRVDVGAQGDDAPRLPAPEDSHDARLRHGVAHLEAEDAEPLRHEVARALLAVAELGVGVQVTAHGDDGRRDPLGGGADLGVGNGDRGSGGEKGDGEQHRKPPVPRNDRLAMIRAVARLLRDLALPVAALALLVAGALRLPLRPHGDAGEYLLMLESWHLHGSPELQPQDRESLRALLAREGLSIDESRVLPNYHAGRDGRLYCYHFWGASLAGLPARRLLEARGLSPLRALPVTNAVLFGLALVAVAFLPWRGSRRLALGGLLLFSPALGFLMWPHPEVLSFALVTIALVLEARGRPAAAVLLAALASLQNPPLVLLVALLWAASALASWRRRSAGPVLLASLAGLPALVPAAFFEWQFGVFNLSVRPSEAAESLSALRALDLAIDPNLGLLPHAPLLLLLGIGGALGALRRRDAWPALLVFVLLPALAFACTANGNWNNDTSGPSRYVVWMLPILAFVAAGEIALGPTRPLGRFGGWALGLALATQAAAVLARGGPLAHSDFLEHSWAARLVLDHRPSLYRPAPEVFVERTLHHEGPFEGPVVYRDANGRCRKAWLQWRHAEALLAQCGEPPGAVAARLAENARRKDAKRDWTYVDY